MKILISLSKELNLSEQARKQRAEKLGFDTTTIWYHGGFEHFDAFDVERSGSGTFNFTTSKEFAENYARTRSQDEEGDYDIVVREYYLPKRLFDYRDKSHIRRLKAVLPESLAIQGNYGWSAWGDPQAYPRKQLLEVIQGIATQHTGLTEQAIKDIKSGKKIIRRDGGTDYIIDYNQSNGTIKYVPSWQMDDIIGLRQQIAFAEREMPNDFRTPLKKLDLKRLEAKLKPYTLKLHPNKTNGFDNWSLLESEELRPFLRKIGFLGCIMQERGKRTACIFDAHNIRLTSAAFDVKQKHSNSLLAQSDISLSGNNRSIIVVDMQPCYAAWMSTAQTEAFIALLNRSSGRILYYYNFSATHSADGNIEAEVKLWLKRIGVNEEVIERCKFTPKTFWFFRDWMERKVNDASIIRTIRAMAVGRVRTSNSLNLQNLLNGDYEDWMDIKPIRLPIINVAEMKQFSKCLIVGGGRNECLREIQLLLNAFNIRFTEYNDAIYD